jgi:hypothetical protein
MPLAYILKFIFPHNVGWGTLVNATNALRAGKSGDRIPVRGKKFITSPARPERPWSPPSPTPNTYRNYFPGIKRLGREVNHSPPSSVEVLNERGYKSSPSKSIRGMESGNLTFTVRHSSLHSDSHAYISNR